MLQYEDEDRDKVLIASDVDLVAAIDHARAAGLKVISLTCFLILLWYFCEFLV